MFARVIVNSPDAKFVNVTVACTQADGAPVDPTAAYCTFYRVSNEDGSLSVDPVLGTHVLNKLFGTTGFWGAPISLVGVTAGEFVVLVELTLGGVATIAVDQFSLYQNLVSVGAPAIVMTPGPSVDHDM